MVMLLPVLLLLVMLLPTAGQGAWYNQAGESGPTVPLQPMHEPTATRPAAAEPHRGPPATSLLNTALGEALAGQVLQEVVREIIKDAVRESISRSGRLTAWSKGAEEGTWSTSGVLTSPPELLLGTQSNFQIYYEKMD